MKYTHAVGDAAQAYCRTFGEFEPRLPGGWRWCELFDNMIAAAQNKAPVDVVPEELDSFNLVISHGMNDDVEAAKNGYKFLGAGISNCDGEVHVFEIKPLTAQSSSDTKPNVAFETLRKQLAAAELRAATAEATLAEMKARGMPRVLIVVKDGLAESTQDADVRVALYDFDTGECDPVPVEFADLADNFYVPVASDVVS